MDLGRKFVINKLWEEIFLHLLMNIMIVYKWRLVLLTNQISIGGSLSLFLMPSRNPFLVAYPVVRLACGLTPIRHVMFRFSHNDIMRLIHRIHWVVLLFGTFDDIYYKYDQVHQKGYCIQQNTVREPNFWSNIISYLIKFIFYVVCWQLWYHQSAWKIKIS